MANDDRRIERIEDKIDGMSEKIGDINVTLRAQHESLKLHMKRSDSLEEAIKPLQKRKSLVDAGLKIIGFLAVIAAIVECLYTVFG